MTELSITAYGTTIRMNDTGGKISKCFKAGIPYERPLLEHIHESKFRGVAVDAGANIGNHTLWFALVCGLETYAFEPLHHELLQQHVALNSAGALVRVVPVALGDCETVVTHVGKGRLDPTGNTLENTDVPDVASGKWISHGTRVPVRTLDSYNLQNVVLIKADVEGMEPYVLRGGEQTVRRDKPVIFAETWGAGEHTEIAAVLEPWGYKVTKRFAAKQSPTPVERWDHMSKLHEH